jgi:putative molybdenum carrier protein
MIAKIISGAQTGADQGGLEAGLTLRLETGGTVPRGRKTDVGPLTDAEMERFKLVEHTSPNYPPRTRANVRDSDGTVLFGRMTSPGCRLTLALCESYNRPYLINPSPTELRRWADSRGIRVLNVAGNRERTNPGIRRTVYWTVVAAFAPLG